MLFVKKRVLESIMIKVAALTSGKNVPSARFRVRQHISSLNSYNVDVKEFIPAINKNKGLSYCPKNIILRNLMLLPFQVSKIITRLPGVLGSWKSDVTWLQRELLPKYLTLEPLLKSPLVFDVDDAIWLNSDEQARLVKSIARRSSVILAGNSYLANWLSQYNSNIHIIPTAVDVQKFPVIDKLHFTQAQYFQIGWIGTSSNLKYLEAIEKSLAVFMKKYNNVKLLVMADKPPKLHHLSSDNVEFIKWSRDSEKKFFKLIHVGLMPLQDTQWAKGKCSFKMLQYMAAGLPVIASPVGMNKDVLQKNIIGFEAEITDDWNEYIEALYLDPELAFSYGVNGRNVVELNYSVDIVSSMIAGVFKSLA